MYVTGDIAKDKAPLCKVLQAVLRQAEAAKAGSLALPLLGWPAHLAAATQMQQLVQSLKYYKAKDSLKVKDKATTLCVLAPPASCDPAPYTQLYQAHAPWKQQLLCVGDTTLLLDEGTRNVVHAFL